MEVMNIYSEVSIKSIPLRSKSNKEAVNLSNGAKLPIGIASMFIELAGANLVRG